MKTNIRRISKRTLALILGVLLMLSTIVVGQVTANATSYYLWTGSSNQIDNWTSKVAMTNTSGTIYTGTVTTSNNSNTFIAVSNDSSYAASSLVADSSQSYTNNVSGLSFYNQNVYSSHLGASAYFALLAGATKTVTVTYDSSTNKVTFSEGSEEETTAATTATTTEDSTIATVSVYAVGNVASSSSSSDGWSTQTSDFGRLSDGTYYYEFTCNYVYSGNCYFRLYYKGGVKGPSGSDDVEIGTSDSKTTLATGNSKAYYIPDADVGNTYTLYVSQNGSLAWYSKGSYETTYQITTVASPEGAGSVTCKVNDTAVSKAAEGKSVVLSNTADEEYTFASYTVTKTEDGTDVTDDVLTDDTIKMPAYPITITANYTAKDKYTITEGVSTNGSVKASKTTAVEGATVTLTCTPDSGYELDSYTVYKTDDASTTVTVSDGKFTMPAYDVTVIGNFKEQTGTKSDRHLLFGSSNNVTALTDTGFDVYQIDDDPYTYVVTIPVEDGKFVINDTTSLSEVWFGLSGSSDYTSLYCTGGTVTNSLGDSTTMGTCVTQHYGANSKNYYFSHVANPDSSYSEIKLTMTCTSSTAMDYNYSVKSYATGAYNITKGNTENGSFKVNRTSADEGTTIKVTPSADTGYELDEVYYVVDGTTDKVAITATNDVYSFSMPAGNVTVYSTFKEKKDPATVYAKTGTAYNQPQSSTTTAACTYAWGKTTTVTADSGVTSVSFANNYNTLKYSVAQGTTITITTTLSSDAPAGTYVGWYSVNGQMVAATKNDDGTYSGTYTVNSSETLEITPVYHNTNYDEDYITLYVKDVDNYFADNWGNTIAIYSYYFDDAGKDTGIRVDGYYCGQPMAYDNSCGYYVAKVPATVTQSGTTYKVAGITLNSYNNDTVHAVVNDKCSSTQPNNQTYDFNNFAVCAENGYKAVRFEPRVSENNADNGEVSDSGSGYFYKHPNETGYSSITTTFGNGWETLVNYVGTNCSLTGYTGTDLDEDNQIYVVSDEDDNSVGSWGTYYYVYDSTGKYVTKGVPSDFIPRLNADGSLADTQTAAYQAIVAAGLDKSGVQITFERENKNYANYTLHKQPETTRLDGIWYYVLSNEANKLTVDSKIIYGNDATSTTTDSWTVDEYASGITGTVTGANVGLALKEDLSDVATSQKAVLDTTVYTTKDASTSKGYQFAGWARYDSDAKQYVIIGTELTSFNIANEITYYAMYVPSSAAMSITYKFKDYQGPNVYAGEGTASDTKADTDASYTVLLSDVTVQDINTDAKRRQLVIDNAPLIQSDYYDYTLEDASDFEINYDESTGTCTATADFSNTGHVYTVYVGTQKFTGYYQWPVKLDAADFDCDSDYALWTLTTELGETIDYQTDVIAVYRFMSDNTTLSVSPIEDPTAMDDTTTLANSYFDLRPDESTTTKLTQNFYIIDHMSDAETLVGGGIIYYIGDEDGNPVNGSANDVVDNTADIVKFIKANLDTDKLDTDQTASASKVGLRYLACAPTADSNGYWIDSNGHYRWSEYIYAWQSIIGVRVTNNVANDDKTICAYSYMIYDDGDGNYTYKVSSVCSIAQAYEAETNS